MLRSLNKIFITNRYHIVLNTLAIFIVVYFFIKNWHADAFAFLVNAYAKFLIFTNIYYVLMFFRYRFYNSIKNLALVRLSEETYYKSIMKYEIFVMAVYYVLLYIVGAMILGTDYLIQYIILIAIFGIILALTQAIHFMALIWKKNIYMSLCLTYIFLAIYTYGIYDHIVGMFM